MIGVDFRAAHVTIDLLARSAPCVQRVCWGPCITRSVLLNLFLIGSFFFVFRSGILWFVQESPSSRIHLHLARHHKYILVHIIKPGMHILPKFKVHRVRHRGLRCVLRVRCVSYAARVRCVTRARCVAYTARVRCVPRATHGVPSNLYC